MWYKLFGILFGLVFLFGSFRYFLVSVANTVNMAMQTKKIAPLCFTVMAFAFCCFVVAILCICTCIFI